MKHSKSKCWERDCFHGDFCFREPSHWWEWVSWPPTNPEPSSCWKPTIHLQHQVWVAATLHWIQYWKLLLWLKWACEKASGGGASGGGRSGAAGKVWIQLLKVKDVLSLTCVMAFISMRLTLQRIGVPVIFSPCSQPHCSDRGATLFLRSNFQIMNRCP